MTGQTTSRSWRVKSRVILWTLLASAVVLGLAIFPRKPYRPPEYIRILDQLLECMPAVRWEGSEPVEIRFVDPFLTVNLKDDHLALVAKIPTFRAVVINFAPNLSDAGIGHLTQLSELRCLSVSFTPIGDETLASLVRMPKLAWLTLYDTHVTDAGLAHLATIQTLTHLQLGPAYITDNGLQILANTPRLESLAIWVDGSRVTEAGVERLRQAATHIEVLVYSRSGFPFSPSPPRKFLASKPPGFDDSEQVLLLEVVEGHTVAQITWLPEFDLLSRMGLNANEAERQGRAIFDAISDRLPATAVQWIIERSPPHDEGTALTDRQRQALLSGRLRLQFTVGCRGGNATSTLWMDE
jgi:hypothetical protein